jgi:hypothetical protein
MNNKTKTIEEKNEYKPSGCMSTKFPRRRVRGCAKGQTDERIEEMDELGCTYTFSKVRDCKVLPSSLLGFA